MSLSAHVATLGRGPGRSRSLTQAEAAEAMDLMLAGQAAPEAIGALLMLLRMKGETAAEIAGFAAAAQTTCLDLPHVDLDWPCYAAGRTRGLPWFLLAARLVALSGYRVVLHGYNGTDAAVRSHLSEAGINTARTSGQAHSALTRSGIAYVPLEHLNAALFELLALRPVFGLRSCINTVARMLNPAKAPASVQGVFHPSYRLLQAEAAQALGWRDLSVIKGGGGEFERHPGKDIQAFGLRDTGLWEDTFPALSNDTRRLAETRPNLSLEALWSGAMQDTFAETIVIGTAALAFDTLGLAAPMDRARGAWRDRHILTEDAA